MGSTVGVGKTTSTSTFSREKVKKIFQYFAEDSDTETLLKEWRGLQPTAHETEWWLSWLLETGFNAAGGEKGARVVEAVSALVVREAVSWEQLEAALQQPMKELEELKIDVPNAEVFYHELMSSLVTTGKFNPIAIRPTTPSKKLQYDLFFGTLKLVKERDGADGLRTAFRRLEEPMRRLSGGGAGNLSKDEFRRRLSQLLECIWW